MLPPYETETPEGSESSPMRFWKILTIAEVVVLLFGYAETVSILILFLCVMLALLCASDPVRIEPNNTGPAEPGTVMFFILANVV